jgi:hypothetical protein
MKDRSGERISQEAGKVRRDVRSGGMLGQEEEDGG